MSDGAGCKCAAYSEWECACGADWRSSREVELENKIKTVIEWCNGNIESKSLITNFCLQVREELER